MLKWQTKTLNFTNALHFNRHPEDYKYLQHAMARKASEIHKHLQKEAENINTQRICQHPRRMCQMFNKGQFLCKKWVVSLSPLLKIQYMKYIIFIHANYKAFHQHFWDRQTCTFKPYRTASIKVISTYSAVWHNILKLFFFLLEYR